MNKKHGLFIGIAVSLLAAMVTFTGCSDDSGGDDNSGGGNSSIVGTWTSDHHTLVFNSNGTLVGTNQEGEVTNFNYTYSGISLTVSLGSISSTGTAVLSNNGNTLTISGVSGFEGTYTKVTGGDPGTNPGGGSAEFPSSLVGKTFKSGEAVLVFTTTTMTVSGLPNYNGTYTLTSKESDNSYKIREPSGNNSTYTIQLTGTALTISGNIGYFASYSPWTLVTGGGGGNSLAGTYAGSGGITLVFRDTDWELKYNGNTQTTGPYNLNGTILTLTGGGQSFTGKAVLSGNALTLSDFTGQAAEMNGTYTKVTGGDPGTNPGGGGNTSIVGTWTSDHRTLVFNSNGTLELTNKEGDVTKLNYTYSGTSLALSNEFNSMIGTAVLSNNGNTLTISGNTGFDGTYTRQ